METYTRQPLPSDDELFRLAESCDFDLLASCKAGNIHVCDYLDWFAQPHIQARFQQLADAEEEKTRAALAEAIPKAVEALKRLDTQRRKRVKTCVLSENNLAYFSTLRLDRSSIRHLALDELANHARGESTTPAFDRSFPTLHEPPDDRCPDGDFEDEDFEDTLDEWEETEDQRAVEHWLVRYEAEHLAEASAPFDPTVARRLLLAPAQLLLPSVIEPASLTLVAGRPISLFDLPVAHPNVFVPPVPSLPVAADNVFEIPGSARPASQDLPVAQNNIFAHGPADLSVAPRTFSDPSGPTNAQAPWFSQPQLAAILGTTRQNMGLHARNLLASGRFSRKANVRVIPTLRTEGSRTVERTIEHYSLDLARAIAARVHPKTAPDTHNGPLAAEAA